MSKTVSQVGMKPPHPGQFIREEILEELELSISCAAQALGVRRASLSDLVHEKTALTPEMALRLEKAFGISMETLLRLQAWYDTEAMRQRSAEISVERFVSADQN
ncbi:MAG: addiction module antidote protein, HigA family [Cyanobacteria bacterium QS_8_64_29]|nr:MAG: addiction module antidote protein, HigA family [Cyanobacteria bacterium QS_8_64_29]